MDKKGFLLGEETLKIIIAVICIGFLIYLLASLYFSNGEAKKTAEANAILLSSSESISAIIDRVKLGNGVDGNSEEKAPLVPKGWNLMSFTGNSDKPNSCGGVNCICICDEVWIDTAFGLMESRQLKECDENGACFSDEDFADQEVNIEIEENTGIIIREDGGQVRILQKVAK